MVGLLYGGLLYGIKLNNNNGKGFTNTTNYKYYS